VKPDDIGELFSAYGPVVVRRMFGGAGVYADGVMFALVHDGVVYLKADAYNAPAFERERLGAFTYSRRGKRAALPSYRRMPDRLYDDPEELAAWARAALAAAVRSAARKMPAEAGKVRKRRKSETR
jgi:DNA transformation protein and related proteins